MERRFDKQHATVDQHFTLFAIKNDWSRMKNDLNDYKRIMNEFSKNLPDFN